MKTSILKLAIQYWKTSILKIFNIQKLQYSKTIIEENINV